MAVVPKVSTPADTLDACVYTTWAAGGATVVATDQFEAVENPGSSDRSIQLIGVAGASGFNGATIVIEGSNIASPAAATAADWATLTDPQGNALSFTAAGLEQVSEVTRWIRPRVSAGTVGTTVTIALCARRG